jgi:DNA-binding GntR family transcriptional regulator
MTASVRALMGGAFVPGDRLSIRQVATALGTSPMPARAALQRLVAERVLEVLPSGTALVPLLTRASFIELRAIRTQLEPLAASLAATRMDAPTLRRLDGRIATLEAALDQGDMEAVLTENQHFMFDIYRAAAAPMLLGIIETLWLRRGPCIGARAPRCCAGMHPSPATRPPSPHCDGGTGPPPPPPSAARSKAPRTSCSAKSTLPTIRHCRAGYRNCRP